MPGLLSAMFEPDQGGSSSAAPESAGQSSGSSPAADDAPGSTSTEAHDESYAIDSDGSVRANPSVHTEQSGSYEGADGSTQQWAHSSDVGLHADTGAAASSISTLSDDSAGTGWGELPD